jgi:N-formylglutamate amidohydrolase
MNGTRYAAMMPPLLPQTFDSFGPRDAQSPVVVSVPHAGRAYPSMLSRMTHYTPDQLMPLEDRYADLLVEELGATTHRVIIARAPRGWIDLNRAESDFDPAMLTPPQRPQHPLSARARGGLGLIPKRTAGLGEIWHAPLTTAQLEQRISTIHRPYHAEVARAMEAAHARFGIAILVDLHSMPTLPRSVRASNPTIIFGDRFGRTCADRYSARAAAIAESAGHSVGFNVPYAGGYILDRHGSPARGHHALQIEFDRSLYLDGTHSFAGDGLPRIQSLFVRIVDALTDEAISNYASIAAE